jgi:hypothetical protein
MLVAAGDRMLMVMDEETAWADAGAAPTANSIARAKYFFIVRFLMGSP